MTRFDEKIQRVPESLLSHIWKGQWLKQGPFPSSDGRMVRVRSTGRENKDSGPDFLNATILLDDEIITGDIELHVKSSDWRAHGHHLDPHFNNVILQVVFWNDSKNPALLESGNHTPTLPLREFLNGSMDDLAVRAESHQVPSLPCYKTSGRMGEKRLTEFLDEFGEERFLLKSASFEIDLIVEEPEQVLYQRVMGALGYTKNKKAFEELARRLPFPVLKSTVQEQESTNRLLLLQALLLGSSGLLPSQRYGKHKLPESIDVEHVENIWNLLDIRESMRYSDWHFFRMHPKNFPTSRLLAASRLLDLYIDKGLLNGVLEHVRNTHPSKGTTLIERGFIVPDILGQGRAREITVNVVLPFFSIWAHMNADDELKTQVSQLYETYPKLGENQITRYLTELFWDNIKSPILKTAKRQQGMIHLYKTYCLEQRCTVCPINPDK